MEGENEESQEFQDSAVMRTFEFECNLKLKCTNQYKRGCESSNSRKCHDNAACCK